MTRSIVEVSKQGRVTLPAGVRRQLGLEEGARLQVDVEEGTVRLRPVQEVPEEDAWFYTRENLEGVRRALEQVKAGEVYAMTVEDLEAGRLPAKPRSKRRRVKR